MTRTIYNPDTVLEALRLAGFDLAPEEFYRIGEEIHRAKQRFKSREGFSPNNLRLPKRIFETPSSIGKLDEEFIRVAIERFKQALFKK